MLFVISGSKRKGLSSASYNVDKQVTEDAETPVDDGSRLVLSGGEGYVDFRIGKQSILFLFVLKLLCNIFVSYTCIICNFIKNLDWLLIYIFILTTLRFATIYNL